MKKYTGTVCFRAYQNITVEAEDEDEARRLMVEEFNATNDDTELYIIDFREGEDDDEVPC